MLDQGGRAPSSSRQVRNPASWVSEATQCARGRRHRVGTTATCTTIGTSYPSQDSSNRNDRRRQERFGP
eukprot:15457037-Alexandrium_andersonii.AAC.1